MKAADSNEPALTRCLYHRKKEDKGGEG